MRKSLFLIATLLICNHAVAQNQKWEVYIGAPNKNVNVWAIINSYDGGYVFDGAKYFGSEGNDWSFKTDVNGQVLYDRDLVHSGGVFDLQSICMDASGNLYGGGVMWFNNAPPSLPAVVKFNACGEPVWCKYLPVTPQSIGGGVVDIIINSKNELIALIFQSTGGHADQLFLAAFDLNGNELWIRPYAKKSDYPLMVNQIGRKLIEHNNGYYIAGHCYYPFPNNPNHVFLRPFFVGIDSNFDEKFVLPFFVMDSVFGEAYSLISINDTILLGVGYRYGTYNKNTLLMLLSTGGEELSYNQITNEAIGPNVQFNGVRQIEKINDTLFISQAWFGVNGDARYGELVYDMHGNLHNSAIRGKYKSNGKFMKTADGAYIFAPTVQTNSPYHQILLYKINANLESVPFDTTQYVYDSLCPYPIQSGTIDLTDCPPTVSIGELPSPDEYYESIRWIPLKAYPNPVSGQELTIEFENTQHHSNMELRLYDAFGKEVHRRRIYTGQQDTRLDVGHWPPGLYLGVIFSNGGAVGRCKVVVE